MTATTAAGPRIVMLDIVRGAAVMGILAMNIVAFAMPQQAYFNPSAYGGTEGADLWAWALSFVFVDGKMRGLFSFLFGASMLLVIERAAAKGENPASVHFRRMGWLLLFGLAHFFLVWWGDILSHYALVGLAAWFFRNAQVGTLVKWAIGLILVQCAVMAMMAFGFTMASAAASAPGATAAEIAAWQTMKADFAPLAADALARDLALYQGPWLDQVEDRLGDWHMLLISLPFFGWETLAYMLLGMAGLKSGFLTGAWDAARYRRWAAVGYAVTVPLYALLAWLVASSGFDALAVVTFGFAAPTPIRPIMIVALAAFLVLLLRNGGWFAERVAAAGRAAFTNYLGTSLLMTFLFYGWGVGLYGELSRAEVYLVVLSAWALMLLWSKPWLERYRYGPFEWAWRSLARGSAQPMRKAIA